MSTPMQAGEHHAVVVIGDENGNGTLVDPRVARVLTE